MKNFLKSVAFAAERYRDLSNKLIDSNAFYLALLIINFSIVGGTVLFIKSSTDACLIPVLLESQQNYDPDIRPANRRL